MRADFLVSLVEKAIREAITPVSLRLTRAEAQLTLTDTRVFQLETLTRQKAATPADGDARTFQSIVDMRKDGHSWDMIGAVLTSHFEHQSADTLPVVRLMKPRAS